MPGNLLSYSEKSAIGRYGLSNNNLIYFSNQHVWSSGRNLDLSMGTESANSEYASKEVLIGFLKGQVVK